MVNLTPDNQESIFWAWFEQNHAKLDLENDVEGSVNLIWQQIQNVHDELAVELGHQSGEHGNWELIISADGMEQLFPYVSNLIESAPVIQGWTFTGFRPRCGSDTCINYQGHKYSNETVFFEAYDGGGKLDLKIFIRDFDKLDESEAGYATFILLDSIIGEYDTVTKIGHIERLRLPDVPEKNRYPIGELPDILDDYVANLNN